MQNTVHVAPFSSKQLESPLDYKELTKQKLGRWRLPEQCICIHAVWDNDASMFI